MHEDVRILDGCQTGSVMLVQIAFTRTEL